MDMQSFTILASQLRYKIGSLGQHHTDAPKSDERISRKHAESPGSEKRDPDREEYFREVAQKLISLELLRKEKDDLKKRCDQLNTRVNDRDSLICTLKKDLNKERQQHEHKIRDEGNMKAKVSEAERYVESIKSEYEVLASCIPVLRATIEEAHLELQRLTSAYEDSVQLVAALTLSKSNMESQIGALEKKYQSVVNQVVSEQAKNISLAAELSLHSKREDAALEKVSRLESRIELLREQLSAESVLTESVQQQNGQVERLMVTARENLTAFDRIKVDLIASYEGMLSKRDEEVRVLKQEQQKHCSGEPMIPGGGESETPVDVERPSVGRQTKSIPDLRFERSVSLKRSLSCSTAEEVDDKRGRNIIPSHADADYDLKQEEESDMKTDTAAGIADDFQQGEAREQRKKGRSESVPPPAPTHSQEAASIQPVLARPAHPVNSTTGSTRGVVPGDLVRSHALSPSPLLDNLTSNMVAPISATALFGGAPTLHSPVIAGVHDVDNAPFGTPTTEDGGPVKRKFGIAGEAKREQAKGLGTAASSQQHMTITAVAGSETGCPRCSENSYGLMIMCTSCGREHHSACVRVIKAARAFAEVPVASDTTSSSSSSTSRAVSGIGSSSSAFLCDACCGIPAPCHTPAPPAAKVAAPADE